MHVAEDDIFLKLLFLKLEFIGNLYIFLDN